MISSSPASNRGRLAVILFGCGILLLAACASNSGNQSSPGVLPKGVANLVRAAGSAPNYCFIPVNFGNGTNTQVTGIRSNANHPLDWRIVGVYATAGGPVNGFVSDPVANTAGCGLVYQNPMAEPPPPQGDSFYLSSLNTLEPSYSTYTSYSYVVGFSTVNTAGGTCPNAVCGMIYNPTLNGSSQFSEVQAPGSCGKTYLYGTSDPDIQVGYYTKPSSGTSCVDQAVEEYTYSAPATTCGSQFSNCTAQFVDLNPGMTNSIAYGINNRGDVVGAEWTTPGNMTGWEYQEGNTYSTFQPFASSTVLRDINWDGIIVGSYQVGTSTQGLVIDGTGTPYQVNGPGGTETIVDAINDQRAITGWTFGGGSSIYGFVGTCSLTTGSTCPVNNASSSSTRSHPTSARGTNSTIGPRR